MTTDSGRANRYDADAEGPSQGACWDCGRRYGDQYGFPDLIVADAAWVQISPTGDDGGLLCPSCILRRLHHLGVTTTGRFTSGPLARVETTPEVDFTAAVRVAHEAVIGRRGVAQDHRACGTACSYWHDADDALTAAAPLIAAQVREQVAREIENRVPDHHPTRGYLDGLRYAARIARGE